MSSNDAFDSIANDIVVGFEVLLDRLDAQKQLEDRLRQQLAKAAVRFNSNNSDNNHSDGAFSEWQDEIVKQISSSTPDEQSSPSNTPPEIFRAAEAIKKLKAEMSPPVTRKCPVAHLAQRPIPTEDGTMATLTQPVCPVTHTSPLGYEQLEKDFTTQGKPSSLECPFAKMTKHGLGDTEDQRDPIAAEFHADSLSAQSLDEARACGKCPIRFMDKHSPEEVAEYFEKHKHELPRSHEICVKRYQQNETSIRQLDAKYGNIVSMIQGLGSKHKQYLRGDEQEAVDGTDQKSTDAVEKWAEDVNDDSNIVDEGASHESRQSHFDKPLRGIRVGESPTRPWGIHVPADRAKADSAVSSQNLDESQSLKQPPGQAQGKPVLEAATPAAHESPASLNRTSITSNRGRPRRPNQIIFNGPVFLGYSPEQAATFLQQLGAGQGNQG